MNFKKPKFWDYKKPNIYAYLLFPIALILQLFQKIKITSPTELDLNIKTICVGNIYLGGTGKTSLSIKLNEILKKKKIKSCFIKKFYKNQSDEQKILEKHGRLFSSKKRINALKQAEENNYQVAIFDDGLQDKSIKYDLKFVCFNNINWIGNGMTLPAGPLRENLNNLANHKNIFINGNLENVEMIKEELNNISSDLNINFGQYVPLNINEFKKEEKYLVFSGIGNHKTFISMVKNYGLDVFKDYEFPDHYNYSEENINKIINDAKNFNCKIITTEKDYFRLSKENRNKINYLKIELKILDEKKIVDLVS